MSDRVLVVSGKWSVASDGLQWILRREGSRDRRTGRRVWVLVSFVRSTKDILARCMREKGCPPEDTARLLAALGERFEASEASPAIPAAECAPQEAEEAAA
jgi:hypothetical protein